MIRSVSHLSIIVATSVGLSACEMVEPYTPPEAALPSKFGEGYGRSAGEVQAIQWWTAFGDRRLNELVATGLAQNIDIRIARERVMAASAVARGAGIPLSGGIGAEGGMQGGSDDPTESYVSGAAGASWTIDLFGALSNERNAAAAGLEAAGYGIESARLAFLAELCAAYIDARFYQESLEIARVTLNSRRRTLELTQRLLDAASATTLDVAQAQGIVDETEAGIPILEANFLQAAHRVSTLLGEPASSRVRMLSPGAAQPYPRRIYASGVPADLLRNRPDIRIAERNLAQATSRTGIAKSALYPSINLLGSITGFAGSDSANTNSWSFGPIISLPIFGRERLNATVSQRESEAREQLLVWQNTVLRAVEEVENGIVAVNRDRRAISAERRAVDSLSEALRLAQESYERGETSLLSVLDAERNVARARNSMASANRRHALSFVGLNVAIGSGRGLGAETPAAGGGNS